MELEKALRIENKKLTEAVADLRAQLGIGKDTAPVFARLRDLEWKCDALEGELDDLRSIITQYDEFYDEIRVAGTAKTYDEMKMVIFGAIADMEVDFEGPDGQSYVPIPKPSTRA